MGQGHILHATAADVGVQYLDPAGGVFIGDNAALIVHQRRNLGGFGSWCGRYVQYPAWCFGSGEQRTDRQH
ncbi:hypothetical protein D3C81_1991730 [compost metagenome]